MLLKEKIQRADPFNNGSCRKISEVEKGLNRPYSREVSVTECKFFLKLKYHPRYSESFLLDVKEKQPSDIAPDAVKWWALSKLHSPNVNQTFDN